MYKKELYNREIYFLSDEHADEYAVFTVPQLAPYIPSSCISIVQTVDQIGLVEHLCFLFLIASSLLHFCNSIG